MQAFEAVPQLSNVVSHVILPKDVCLNERDMCDLEMLCSGAFAPNEGYMTLADYQSCVKDMRLSNGAVWTIPIVLAIEWNTLKHSQEPLGNQEITLRDKTNAIICKLTVTDVFKPDLEEFKQHVLGSTDPNHPYSKYISANHKGCVYVGGKISDIRPVVHFDFRQYRLPPSQVKAHIKEMGWETVVGFQTRNPMHRSHFELTVQALEEATRETGKTAHLLLTPAVGPTQPGDVEYQTRVRCYERIINHYPTEPQLILLPLAMRMAGPREAVWHACIRKNYGCTHFIVGRDHAGPSSRKQDGSAFYGPYDAHDLIRKFQGEIGIKPILGKNMLYVDEKVGFQPEDQVSDPSMAKTISGTEFRRMLVNREPVPAWFCFSDVVKELHRVYVPQYERGLCVYFTGLPCSGKSTLACCLEALFMECPNEKRRITVLDADVIRTHLSKGLGFSREDRQANVRRIGYIASEITKHGGICLVANIAPYAEDREFNKNLVTTNDGNYVEIYVSTPLDVCEKRDIKELYKKARLGEIKQFTGISDPYEIPANADLVVDSSTNLEDKVKQVFQFLKDRTLVA